MSPSNTDEPSGAAAVSLNKGARRACGVLGVIFGLAGVVTVFVKNNGVGSAALLAVAVLFGLMAVSGYIFRLKIPGGGEVSLELRKDAKVGKEVKRALTEASELLKTDAEAAIAKFTSVVESSAREAGIPNPRETARELTGWPELRELVDAVESELRATNGVTVARTKGAWKPRLVATVDGARYGLYVMAGKRPSSKWVEQTIAGAAKVGDDVHPALVIEHPPIEWLQKSADEHGVLVIWRSDDGHWHNAPWVQDSSAPR